MPAPKNIDEALLLLQAERIVLRKDRDGQVGNQRTKYADLVQANEVILAKLHDLGVVWKTKPTVQLIPGPNGQQDPRFVLQYELKHVASGTAEEGIYPLPAGANPMQNGSAITYARRYALLAITNAVADDDDDDGRGYAGQRGMAQRANVRQQQTTPATAQRAAAAPRAERAAPAQRPEVPAPTSPAPAGVKQWTDPMMRKWMAQNRDAGITGDAIKAVAADMLGRQIGSSKEITFGEMRGMIDAFEKALKDPDTAAATVIDIYRRTSGDGGAPGPETTPTTDRPPARKQAARKAAPPARSTRESVTGTPAGPDDEAPPWETEPPADPEWPETAAPGSGGL